MTRATVYPIIATNGNGQTITKHRYSKKKTQWLYLSLTIQGNGKTVTLPLTPFLLAMWLMAALPLMAAQIAQAMTYSIQTILSQIPLMVAQITQAMTYSTLTLASQVLLMVIMSIIFVKALAWGVRS